MACLQALPSTTDDSLLNNLTPGDIMRYSRTSRDMHATVRSYIKRRFKLHNILSRFFVTESQTLAFRRLMSETGIIIAGSTALQFFDRTTYPDSDLDLYLPVAAVRRVVDWLVASGYRYTPKKDQAKSVDTAIHLAYLNRNPRDAKMGLSGQELRGYLKAALVLDMEKDGDSPCKIQLIASFRSVIELLLCYHSTCVMNFITHDKAYCLFPCATLDERRALTFLSVTSRDPQEKAAYEKYTSRGWKLFKALPWKEEFDPKSSFAPGKRHIGDGKCWSLPIYPEHQDLCKSRFHANSFNTVFNEALVLKFQYEHLALPIFLHGYLMEPLEALSVLRANMTWLMTACEVKQSSGNSVPDGHDAQDNELLQMIMKYRDEPQVRRGQAVYREDGWDE